MNEYIPNTIHQCKDGAGGFQVALINLWCQHKNGVQCFIKHNFKGFKQIFEDFKLTRIQSLYLCVLCLFKSSKSLVGLH